MTEHTWLEIIAIGVFFALLFHGWPGFFTINITKKYYKKDEPDQ